MAFSIKFNEEKNQLLKATRLTCFDDVILALKKNGAIADIHHPSVRHPNQRLYVVIISGYAYAVPYVINEEKQEIFLKTVYPSRVLTKKYVKGVGNEKDK